MAHRDDNGLRCPECLGALAREPGTLRCADCGSVYDSVWDIPDFARRRDYFYSPCPRDWLDAALLRMAPERGELPVDEFLRRLIDRIPESARKQEWVENLVDESRAAFKLLLSPRPGGRILNLGCGWDETTINLARNWGRVTAIDLTRDRIQVLDVKRRGTLADRIDLAVGGDRPRLPFADGLFDAVCLNGVLEWVAADWTEVSAAYASRRTRAGSMLLALREVLGARNPRRRQLAFLREVRRVLRPDGEIYIGIENRYGREYFRGRPDHHSRLLFGSLYPRILSHLISLLKTHKPYLTYTYSRRGYRRLLAEAGFPEAAFQAVEPSYRQPLAFVDLDDKAAVDAHQRSTAGHRRPLPARLYARTVPAFAIVAGTDPSPRSLLRTILDGVAAELDLPAGCWRGATTLVNRKGKATVVSATDDSAAQVVVKIPLVPLTGMRLRTNAAALRALASGLPESSPLKPLLPRPLLATTIAGMTVHVESALPGRPWAAHRDVDDDALLREAAALAGRVAAREVVCADVPEGSLTDPAQADLLVDLLTRTDPGLAPALADVKDLLGDGAVSAALRKGDGSLSNVLAAQGRISALIDWDDSVLTRHPLSGLTDLLFSWAWHRRGASRADTLTALVSGDRGETLRGVDVDAALAAFAGGRAAESGRTPEPATPRDLALAALASWLDHASQELQHPACGFSRARVEQLLVEPCRRVAPLLDALR